MAVIYFSFSSLKLKKKNDCGVSAEPKAGPVLLSLRINLRGFPPGEGDELKRRGTARPRDRRRCGKCSFLSRPQRQMLPAEPGPPGLGTLRLENTPRSSPAFDPSPPHPLHQTLTLGFCLASESEFTFSVERNLKIFKL